MDNGSRPEGGEDMDYEESGDGSGSGDEEDDDDVASGGAAGL